MRKRKKKYVVLNESFSYANGAAAEFQTPVMIVTPPYAIDILTFVNSSPLALLEH